MFLVRFKVMRESVASKFLIIFFNEKINSFNQEDDHDDPTKATPYQRGSVLAKFLA